MNKEELYTGCSVKIVKCTSDHPFKIGSIVVVSEVNDDYIQAMGQAGEWSLQIDEIELSKPESDPLEEYHKEDRLFELYKQNLQLMGKDFHIAHCMESAKEQLDYFNTNK